MPKKKKKRRTIPVLKDNDGSGPPEIEVVPEPEAEVEEPGLRLQADLDEAIEAKKRAMADFVNFQRRARESEAWARRDGAASVVRSLLAVLDNFDLAVGQDREDMTAEQLLEGVRMVREELRKALEEHGVAAIDPEAGSEFDPNLHRAVLRDETDRQAPNTIVSVLQVGYAVDETVLRPASVSVAFPLGDAED